MKKFLMFCLICVVTVSVGLMTYRFLTLEEVLTVNTTYVEVNKGEEVPLEVTCENKKGELVFESLDEDVVSYDLTLGRYYALKGGKARLQISSTTKGTIPIMVTVMVGDGTELCPYYIKSADDLAQIGKTEVDSDGTSIVKRPLDAYYSLCTDLDLSTYGSSGEWTPIGSQSNAFTGVLLANDHTITGLKITTSATSAGIFAKIGANSTNTNNISGGLTISGATISGEFAYAGALAGINEGLITKVNVVDSLISSSASSGYVGSVFGKQIGQLERVSVTNCTVSGGYAGGLVGMLKTESTIKAQVNRSYTSGVNVKCSSVGGGLVGLIQGGIITNSYAKLVQDTNGSVSTDFSLSTIVLGGIAGQIEVVGTETETTIVDCYSTLKIGGNSGQKRGQLIGYVVDKKSGSVTVANKLYGLYYEAEANSGMFGLGYIQTIGTVSALATEQNNYEFVYNTLVNTVEQARINGGQIVSHSTTTNRKSKQYYWDISSVWVINLDDYPTLDMNGAYFDISEITESISSAYDIKTLSDLQGLQERVNAGTETYAKSYVLRANIDLSTITNWIAIGTDDNPFTGVLTCETDENGQPLYKITGLANTQSQVSGGSATTKYTGLFGVVGGQGVVSNIVIENPSIKQGQYVSALAGKNYGTISNCKVVSTTVSATIQTNNVGYSDTNVVYIGGAVAYNEGTISKVKVQGILVRSTTSKEQSKIYLGGVVAYNNGTVEYSSYTTVTNSSNQILSNQNVDTTIGGLVGYNNGSINSCYVSGDDSSSVTIVTVTSNEDIMLGGLAGENSSNGKIEKSFVKITAEGTNVGGIAGLNYGKIQECYSISELTGYKVGGLVYYHAGGKIQNCYTMGTLYGVNNSSYKSGFAHDVALESSKDLSCAIVNCFSSNQFDGNGKSYYDVHYEQQKMTIRTNDYLTYKRKQGFVINSIFEYESNSGVNRSNKPSGFLGLWGNSDYEKSCEEIIRLYNKEQEYYSYQEDCALTASQICSEQGANVFRTYGFSEDIWELVGGSYPTLKNVVKG